MHFLQKLTENTICPIICSTGEFESTLMFVYLCILFFNQPDGQLIGHHDLLICVGHKQPDRILQYTLDELGLSVAPCCLLTRVVVLRRVHAAKILARVAALTASCRRSKTPCHSTSNSISIMRILTNATRGELI